MFCWPCITVYQYSETNVMHFLLSLLRIKGLYMFRALLAHLQEALDKRHLVYCVRVMSVGCYKGRSGTKSLKITCVVWFCLHVCLNYFSLWEELDITHTWVFMYSTRHSCQILIKPEFSRKIFEPLKSHFSWKSVQWDPNCSTRVDRQTDRRPWS
jgi:hypothetical protein